VRLSDLGDHVKRELEEKVRAHADRLQADSQAVYDQVLRDAQGKDVTVVRDLLAREWRAKFGTAMPEPDLSKNAEILARGDRLVAEVNVKM
jgi:hypothetical protein